MSISTIILVLCLAVFTSTSKAQDDFTWRLSSCEVLSSILKPVTNLDVKKFQGHWVNLNKASFGTKDVANFSVDQDQSMIEGFTVNVNQKKKLEKVDDCIRQELIQQNQSHILVKTALFYRDAKLNTGFDSTFLYDPVHPGHWVESDIDYEDVLVLQADPEKHLVIALCGKFEPRFNDDKIRTTIITLGRYNKRRQHLGNEEQLKIMTDIARKLGQNEFLASQLEIDCNGALKFNFNIFWIFSLFLITKYVF